MDYKQFNEIFANLNQIRYGTSPWIKLTTEIEHEIRGGGDEGRQGVSYEVYGCPFDSEVYLRFTITTDSYGDNEQISGIQFVKVTEKTIKTYESL